MSSFFGAIEVLMLCGTLLVLALMVLVAIPNCQMREVAVDVVKSVLGGIVKGIADAKEAQEHQSSSARSSK
ncbi:MAG: hypothetical protein KDA86_20450 [Planctomycetaceae bacterium]|nr:hypothetical protein [Planctomycetaceae bacterium]